MKLIINGQSHDARATTLDTLLAELGYDGRWQATALNSEFVPCDRREQARLRDGDRIEILSPRQGG